MRCLCPTCGKPVNRRYVGRHTGTCAEWNRCEVCIPTENRARRPRDWYSVLGSWCGHGRNSSSEVWVWSGFWRGWPSDWRLSSAF